MFLCDQILKNAGTIPGQVFYAPILGRLHITSVSSFLNLISSGLSYMQWLGFTRFIRFGTTVVPLEFCHWCVYYCSPSLPKLPITFLWLLLSYICTFVLFMEPLMNGTTWLMLLPISLWDDRQVPWTFFGSVSFEVFAAANSDEFAIAYRITKTLRQFFGGC